MQYFQNVANSFNSNTNTQQNGSGGIWSWNNNGNWQNFDIQSSKQIDTELRNQWQQTQTPMLCFPITKGPWFSKPQNRGVYFCNVQLDHSRTQIKGVMQQNTKTGFGRPMKRTPPFQLKPNKGSPNPSQHSHSNTHNTNNTNNNNSVQWSWQDTTQWRSYDSATQTQLESGYSDPQRDSVSLSKGDYFGNPQNRDVYLVQFHRRSIPHSFEQINTHTLFSRNVQRTGGDVTMNESKAEMNEWSEFYEPMTVSTFEALKDKERLCNICFVDFEKNDLFLSKNESKEDESGLSNDTIIHLNKCVNKESHYFHRECIDRWLGEKGKCSHCQVRYAIETGNQPKNGRFDYSFLNDRSCKGFESFGSIKISFAFGNGIQGTEHYHCGQPFYGTHREAFVPNTAKGRECLELTKIAWRRRLIFTVGASLTTQRENCVVWSSIHYKTRMEGGAQSHGWPDPTYFERFKDELKAKGVTADDLDQSALDCVKNGYH